MVDRSWGHLLKRTFASFFLVILTVGALCCGYFFFTTVRALVARTSLPFSETIVQASAGEMRTPGRELPMLVEKKERVNILLLGIDRRDQELGPWRTDTMILVSIDAATNSVSMLSIPRDLWVTIPGFGESRVNMAHYLGDARDYPGGGPALAKKAVWYALGVPVDYYVRVDFAGFEKLIDAIGGLTIDVAKAIHDEKYPDSNYGTFVVDIAAGIQHMDGKTTLQYARSRHGTGDFDRMARQQVVILAARDKVLSLDIPVSRVPQLLDLAGDSVRTDLSLEDILALAEISRKIGRSGIRHGVIGDSMTTTVITPDQQMVEVADWDKVRALVDDLFPAPVPSAQPTPSLVKAQLASEGARIALQNGTLVTGLAQKTADTLRSRGLNVIRYENASRFDHAQTVIIVYNAKPYTTDALATELGVLAENIRHEPNGSAELDIVVILGRDYAQLVSRE